jgi:protein-S-isoprenylcysteine O-methyltransferase Ste14
MALREEFRASGEWLFRKRSYVPLAVLALMVYAMRGFGHPAGGRSDDLRWEALCALVALLGEAIRVTTVGFVPRGTSGGTLSRPNAESLNTTGVYSVVRHPLYLGNFLMWMGVAMLTRNGWFTVVVALAFWIYYERVMYAEEEYLRERYGEEFLVWAARTPAFLPRPGRWVPSSLPFSVRAVLKREYPSVFAAVCCFTVVEVLGDYQLTGHLVLDPLWAAIFSVGAVTFLALRTMKHTGLLDVPGR